MIRRTFLALTAATAFSMPAFADNHAKDIVDTAVGAGPSPRWSPQWKRLVWSRR